jgi:hypothetical protein
MCRLIATTLGALIGCTDATAPVDNVSPVHASQADGRRAILDAFDAKEAAYVVASGQLAAGDYFYRVTDASGEVLSTDGLVCRRVHIGDDGTIDVAYDGLTNGAPCQHPCKFAVDGGLTLQLVPFADEPSHSYRVEVAQAEDFADAVADAFFVGTRP